MAVLKNECSNLSTVLGAVRELEMAQRSVCVWQGEHECVPTSKLPLILLPLVNPWLASFPGLPHFFCSSVCVQYNTWCICFPVFMLITNQITRKKQGGLGTRLVLGNDGIQECIKTGSLSKSVCLCACLCVCVCVCVAKVDHCLIGHVSCPNPPLCQAAAYIAP